MDAIGDLIARVLAAPDDDRALGMVKAEVERLCRQFPLYPDSSRYPPGPGLRARALARRRAVFAESGALARVVAGFEPRDGQRRDGRRRSPRIVEDGGTLLAEAGTGTGKTLAYLIPGDPQPAARAGLDRHQEPAGADLLQGPSGAARRRSACRSPPR